jgi:TDG/mug DNA glycosylase family protein
MPDENLVGHQVHMSWGGQTILTLLDLVPQSPSAIFIGYNPRPESVQAGHYYQGARGKQFWHYLVTTRFIPPPDAGDFHEDLMYRLGYGLSDLSKRPGKHAIDVEESDVNWGRPILRRKIEKWQPRVICSVFKGALEKLFERPLVYGLNSIDSVAQPIFVIPFPPGIPMAGGERVNAEHILRALGELRALIDAR